MEESATCLLGAIAVDIIGSVYEFPAPKSNDFVLFTPSSQMTDDSILPLVVADAIFNKGSYKDRIQEFARSYHGRGYGGLFSRWTYTDDPQPYHSTASAAGQRCGSVRWGGHSIPTKMHYRKLKRVRHSPTIILKGSRALKPWRYLFFEPEAGWARMPSARKSLDGSYTIFRLHWMKYDPVTSLMKLVRELSRRRSLLSWSQMIMKMPFEKLYHSFVMRIPSLPSPDRSPRYFMGEYPKIS